MRRAWHLTAEESQAVMMPYQPTCCTCSAELTASPALGSPSFAFQWLYGMCMQYRYVLVLDMQTC